MVGGGGGIPGLKQLLARLGLPAASTQPAKGGEALGPADPEVFGPDGQLLTGLGFSEADVRSSLRNRTELHHLRQFLASAATAEATSRDLGGAKKALGPEGEAETSAQNPDGGRDPGAETRAWRSARGEMAERAPDEALPQEPRGEREAKEPAELHRQRPDDPRDEEERPGHGWWADDGEDEDANDRRGEHEAPDAFAHEHRCRARLEDGRRCLHRAAEGLPYCTLHQGAPAGPVGPTSLETPSLEPPAAPTNSNTAAQSRSNSDLRNPEPDASQS